MVSDFVIFCCIVLINKSHFTISIWWLIQSRTLSYAMILNWEFHTYIWSVKLCNTQKLQVRIEYPSFHLKGEECWFNSVQHISVNSGFIAWMLSHSSYCIIPTYLNAVLNFVLLYSSSNIIFFINIRKFIQEKIGPLRDINMNNTYN